MTLFDSYYYSDLHPSFVYLATHFSGIKVDVTKFSQILPLYTETINAVFKKSTIIIKILLFSPIEQPNFRSNKPRMHKLA